MRASCGFEILTKKGKKNEEKFTKSVSKWIKKFETEAIF